MWNWNAESTHNKLSVFLTFAVTHTFILSYEKCQHNGELFYNLSVLNMIKDTYLLTSHEAIQMLTFKWTKTCIQYWC